ncbi:MAG: polymerase subunit sigma-24 [Alphaproteobacteria bacterium]|nr:polymerase subunit sigma-24 [Alphaproteobacteria bacterium]
MTAIALADLCSLPDPELARRIAAGDRAAIRLVTERNNQRLFRAAWSILKNRDDAEDAVQSAYLNGFAAIHGFAGRASLSTWLTRIVINEALGRLRATRRRRERLDSASVVHLDEYREKLMRGSTSGSAPDAALAREQIRALLEQAIGDLPDVFRHVFVLREVEGLSVEEAAEVLDILPATVKTRHLRARRRLQQALAPDLRTALTGTFPFAGADCARMTERVLAALG